MLQAFVGGSGSGRPSGRRGGREDDVGLGSASGGRRRRRHLGAVGPSGGSRGLPMDQPDPQDVDIVARADFDEVLELLTCGPCLEEEDVPKPQVLVNALKEIVPERYAQIPGAVLLHVYNLNEDLCEANKTLNFTSDIVAIGGVFHVGTEIFGGEWSFGVCGVTCIPPRTEEAHVYQCTIYMGRSLIGKEELAAKLLTLAQAWRGKDYDMIGRNCCSFAAELCAVLGVGELPCWVDRFARFLHGGRTAGLAALEGAKSLPSIIEREVVRFSNELPLHLQRNTRFAADIGQMLLEVGEAAIEDMQPFVEVAAKHMFQGTEVKSGVLDFVTGF
mmetsp:Transcript_28908/g.83831  ORF Transcript_28908/g.83831 Transcript_28908/m.83831 type:complete len:331 (-) Transcript_28908:19-1011(-)